MKIFQPRRRVTNDYEFLVLWVLLDMCVVVYLDDILIYSDGRGEHNNHVREVLMPRAGLVERREGMRSSGNHMSKPQR